MQKTTVTNQYLSNLIAETEAIISETKATFSHLTSEQINWKPAADKWSVGQCFDHLITTNNRYFDKLEPALAEWQEKGLFARKPFKSTLFGKFFIKSMQPDPKRKQQAPPIFEPSNSGIHSRIFDDFIENQMKLIGFIEQADGSDLNRIKITSPVTKLIRFKLGDCFNVIVTHEKRHVLQAKRILQLGDFSNG